MYRVFSNKEVREIEKKAAGNGVRVRDLLERAGQALAERVFNAMEERNIDDVLFVLGGGNNAGDGFVAARILAQRGKEVAALCLTERLSAECARAKLRFQGEIFARMPRRRYAMIVDCIFGTGLTRPPERDAAELISMINSSGAYIISCDLPSGLSENGVALSPCVRADETVTMGLMKSALLMADGVDRAGVVTSAEIGLSADGESEYSFGAQVWEREDVKAFFPPRMSNVHKGSFGRAYLLSNGARLGACVLSASACMRSGAGYTVLRIPVGLCPYVCAAQPDLVVEELAPDLEIPDADAIALGMGFGASEALYTRIASLLKDYRGTLILDADALTVLARFGLSPLKERGCDVILTPHPKEFALLTGETVETVLNNAREMAMQFASQYNVTVILKNNRSLITDGVRCVINTTGSPALAKCGSGDVLTGLLAGTCARGVPPFEAAVVSSYILGKAGEISGRKRGQFSVTPTDVIENIADAILETVR